METEDFAAYHGPGWKPRGSSLSEEIRAGELWAPLLNDCEDGRLTDVLLHMPGTGLATVQDPDSALHVRPVDHVALDEQHEGLAEAYESLGVRVHRVDSSSVDDRRHPNAIFLADVFWQTPHGAVVSRMASPQRAGEERHVAAALARIGVPIAVTIGGSGVCEGADWIWLRPDLALCGLGPRTNREGFDQVRAVLEPRGVRCVAAPFPLVCMHLMGCVRIVSAERALVRSDDAQPELLATLADAGYEVVDVAESEEIVGRLAFNFVVLDRNRVLMPAGCPRTRTILEQAGVEVVAEMPISEYVNMAGGPACASGVLRRERRTP